MYQGIVIIGTMDTKGDQFEYLIRQIEAEGHQTITIDIGVVGPVPFECTYSREKVAVAAGTNLEEIIALSNHTAGLAKMGEGATSIVKELYAQHKINGIVVGGGSQGTAVTLEILKALPTGFPKLVISTVAYSPTITAESIGGVDTLMMPWLAGLYGLNSIVRQTLNTAAGAISGAAKKYDKPGRSSNKIAGITSLGPSISSSLKVLKPGLESRGWEAAVFHVNGISGRNYEQAIADGLIQFSLDLHASVELLSWITDGSFNAGANRLEAAGKAGIPQIVSPGAIGAFHWDAQRPLPDKYKDRIRTWHNALVCPICTSHDEAVKVGSLMAEKLNRAKGPTAVVLTMKGHLFPGVPIPPEPNEPPERLELPPIDFWSYYVPSTMRLMKSFRDVIADNLRPEIKLIELDVSFDDQVYVDTVLDLFDEMAPK